MTDIPLQVLLQLLAFLSFPLIGGFLAVRFRISPLIGYIIGGIFLNIFFGRSLPRNFINNFSMLGLILLVFTIGLETNFDSIRRFGKFVIVGGILQITVSAFFITFLSLFFHFNLIESIFFGFAFALSSTAVVSKIIQERGEENSLLGGLVMGVLILQDLAFIPLLIIFSSFGTETGIFEIIRNVVFNSVKAAFVLFIVYYLGQRIIPMIFNKIAKVSREILNLFIILFILFSLALFSFLGLSSLLAAFIAGVLLGQTLEHYHIFSQIRPLRDLLAIVFFVFLGLTIQPEFILTHFLIIVPLTFFIIVIKLSVILVIYLIFRFHTRTAFSLAIFLFQIGEDAFILIYQGLLSRAVRPDSYYIALSVVLLTLLLTPYLIANVNRIYTGIRKFIKVLFPFLERFITYRVDREAPNIDVLPLKNHIILCGYGRVGSYVGRALLSADIPFIAIDYNFHIVEKVKKEGIHIIYGDPTEIDVLDYAECENANILIAAVPERYSQEMIILNAKRLNPKIIIFTRVHREGDHMRMKDLGVEVVVQPEFEASLSIIRKILLLKGLTKEEISSKIKRLKMEHGMI